MIAILLTDPSLAETFRDSFFRIHFSQNPFFACRSEFSVIIVRHVCEKTHMKPTRETKPFPHTKFTTDLRRSKWKDYDLWDDLVNYLARNYLDPEKWAWAFRGISQCNYRLESKLERELKGRIDVDRQTAEDYLLSQFKRAAHHFAEPSMVPGKDDKLEWLALMQHYGAPTRLLDFTRSPYVACFFALKNADTNDCAIWAIDTNWIVEKSFSRVERKFPGHHDLTTNNLLDSEFMSDNFHCLFMRNSEPMILPIVPSKSNARILVQQGLFLCPSAVDRSFEENLSSYSYSKNDIADMQDHVHKIVIKSLVRREVLSELHYMNISQASLFPSLEGFATSLTHELMYKSSDEIKRSR